jgi:hypothetical protein
VIPDLEQHQTLATEKTFYAFRPTTKWAERENIPRSRRNPK